jgi:hypothetical protein
MRLSANERYEIEASAFRIMTGHMAPGKSASPMSYPAPHEERRAAWEEWIEKHGEVIRALMRGIEDFFPDSDQTGFCPDPNDKNDDHVDHAAAEEKSVPPPELSVPAVELTPDCVPGQFVTWTDVQGWTYTGTLKEWDNGTAIIEWPMIQTPLIAVRG